MWYNILRFLNRKLLQKTKVKVNKLISTHCFCNEISLTFKVIKKTYNKSTPLFFVAYSLALLTIIVFNYCLLYIHHVYKV